MADSYWSGVCMKQKSGKLVSFMDKSIVWPTELNAGKELTFGAIHLYPEVSSNDIGVLLEDPVTSTRVRVLTCHGIGWIWRRRIVLLAS